MTFSRPRILTALLLVLTLPAFGAGCTVNPATGQQSFTGLMSEAQEAQIGHEAHAQILEEFGGSYADSDIQNYIASLGALLARTSERPNLRYTFTVLDTPVVNAFALPGGYVYVTRGLLALANNESEVAGVLAHEIGHVAARHAAQRYSQAGLAGVLAAGLGVLTGSSEVANLAGTGAAIYLQSYSRDQEFEADLLAVRYMGRANYDPGGLVSFLAQLQADDRLDAALAGRPDLADRYTIMSSHPRTADRIERAIQQAGVTTVAAPLVERDLYLAKIDGMLYGDQPEQGFIRGRRFAHPQLRFEFEVPPGFHMINSSAKVLALRGDGAQIIFDRVPLEGSGSLVRYLTSEWAPRLAMRDAEPIDVNGMEAATGSGRLQAESGPLDVRLVAIRFDPGTVYRFTFVTKPALTAQLEFDLRQTTYSFRRLSNREAAALRPQRLAVIRVRPGDTVAQIARSMPFDDLREERFRVLNGLGPNDRLQAGQLVKTIVE